MCVRAYGARFLAKIHKMGSNQSAQPAQSAQLLPDQQAKQAKFIEHLNAKTQEILNNGAAYNTMQNHYFTISAHKTCIIYATDRDFTFKNVKCKMIIKAVFNFSDIFYPFVPKLKLKKFVCNILLDNDIIFEFIGKTYNEIFQKLHNEIICVGNTLMLAKAYENLLLTRTLTAELSDIFAPN